MKKLGLALISLCLLSCGSTAKNEISKIVPQPQQGEGTEDFRRRCAFANGAFNKVNDPTMCRVTVKSVTFPRETDQEDQDFSFGDLAAGFQISGSYEGSASAPELVVARVVEARGNMNLQVIPRGGAVFLRAYAGNYEKFAYTVYRCFGLGNNAASCAGF